MVRAVSLLVTGITSEIKVVDSYFTSCVVGLVVKPHQSDFQWQLLRSVVVLDNLVLGGCVSW